MSQFVFGPEVTGGLANLRVDYWAQNEFRADVVLLEDADGYLSGDSYLVRNTKFARAFLLRWAAFVEVRPTPTLPDVWALPLVVADAVAFRNADTCWHLFGQLVGDSAHPENWRRERTFLACVKSLIGAPRQWRLEGPLPGVLSILPRFHGWLIDASFATPVVFNEAIHFMTGLTWRPGFEEGLLHLPLDSQVQLRLDNEGCPAPSSENSSPLTLPAVARRFFDHHRRQNILSAQQQAASPDPDQPPGLPEYPFDLEGSICILDLSCRPLQSSSADLPAIGAPLPFPAGVRPTRLADYPADYLGTGDDAFNAMSQLHRKY